MESKKAISVLKDMLKNGIYYAGNAQLVFSGKHKEALSEALLALEGNDCVAFGYWLVNAPNKELYSKKWVEQKYQQYLREKESGLK